MQDPRGGILFVHEDRRLESPAITPSVSEGTPVTIGEETFLMRLVRGSGIFAPVK